MSGAVVCSIVGALFVSIGAIAMKGYSAQLRCVCTFLGFVLLAIAAFQFDAQRGGWWMAASAVFGVFAILTVVAYIAYRNEKQRLENDDL